MTPGTDSGQPAASTAFRAMSKVCSPTWLTQPQITSSTSGRVDAGARGQRLEHLTGQVHRVNTGQTTVALADRRPYRRHDYCIPH